MDLSGLIFLALALAWAAYLLPKALRHHDEIARTRCVDRFSDQMRVVARREPVDRTDARLVVRPARSPVVSGAPARSPVVPGMPAPASVSPPGLARRRRGAVASAERRRRRLLFLLLLVVAGSGGAAGLGMLPGRAVAVPASLVVAFLFWCRHEVRREQRMRLRLPRADTVPVGAPGADRGAEQEVSSDEDSAAVSVLLDTPAPPTVDADEAPAAAAAGASLWDPLPLTLPTYVTKPRAPRTVRTIDLSQPGTWTSGRQAEDSQLVAEAAVAATQSDGPGEQEAVGS